MSEELQRKVLLLVLLLGVVNFLTGCSIPDLPGPIGIPGL